MKDQKFLQRLNTDLLSLEEDLSLLVKEEYANIFVLGLPRSGTTLLSQLIFNNMDVGCINNLIAKFWGTPLVGCMLSKLTITDKSESYESYYGKTGTIDQPHEYSWFWQKYLKIEDIENYHPEEVAKKIDWGGMKLKFLNFNRITGKSFVHKPLELVGYHMKIFDRLFEKAIFIYIHRPMDEVAVSLSKSRQFYYNDMNVWWGSYPPYNEYQLIKDKTWPKQIAGQVFFLERMWKEKLQQIRQNTLIETSFTELKEDPASILQQIHDLSAQKGKAIPILNQPNAFSNRSDKKYSDDQKQILQELDKLKVEYA